VAELLLLWVSWHMPWAIHRLIDATERLGLNVRDKLNRQFRGHWLVEQLNEQLTSRQINAGRQWFGDEHYLGT
jgi:hypothetical protein